MSLAVAIDEKDYSWAYNYGVGIVISLLIHLCLAFYFLNSRPHMEPETISVELVMPEIPKRQIVTSPQNQPEQEKPNEDAKFLSDKNFSTPKDQIKRGDDPLAGIPGKTQNQSAVEKTLPKAPKAAEPPKPSSETQPKQMVTSLKLNPNTLAQKFTETQPKVEKPSLDQEINGISTAAVRPFHSSYGTAAAFNGTPGSNDYVPNLADGDITLLNTKASQFAVFVRRVAEQVFTRIRFEGYNSLQASDIRSVGREVTISAIMTLKGQLISTEIKESSGSPRFDTVVLQAAQKGANDQNPPAAAAATDGNIHFIFQSRSWVRFLPSPHEGLVEQRWLILGTGLE